MVEDDININGELVLRNSSEDPDVVNNNYVHTNISLGETKTTHQIVSI